MVTNSSMNASGFNGSFSEVPYNRCACCQHSAVCALNADYKRAFQQALAAMGYTEVGAAEGTAGPKFTKAVKRLQKEKGKRQDSEITADQTTWKLLLGMLK